MKKTHAFGVAVGLTAMLASGTALAQERTYPEPTYEEPPPAYEQRPYEEPVYYGAEDEQHLLTPWGMAFAVGGGVAGFTGEELRETTDVGGSWEARLIAGTRQYIGGEVAYIGTAQGIDAVGLDPDAVLLGNGVEGAIRVNFLTGALQPFISVGAGWRRYDVVNDDFNTSAVRDEDDVLTVPLTGGVAYRFSNLMLGVRGGVRPAFYSDLIRTGVEGASPGLTAWDVRADLGWEF